MAHRSLRLLAVLPVTATLALLAWSGPAAPGARAAGTVTIPLDPGVVELSFAAQQNVGTLPVAIPVRHGTFHAAPARYGGTVIVTVPPQKADSGQLDATLALENGDDPQSRTYSTDPRAPADDRLAVTALGGGRYRVQLPADDGVNGPVARLLVMGPQLRPGIDVVPLDPVGFVLDLSATGPASVQLTYQAVAMGCPPGQTYAGGCGPIDRLTPGDPILVTLPPASRLRQVGLTGLANSAFALQSNGPEFPSQLPATQLSAKVSADGATATMTVPDGMKPGAYQFTAVAGDKSGELITITGFRVDVVAAATSSATPSTGASPSGTPPSSSTSQGAAPAGGGNDTGGTNRTGLWVALGSVFVLAAGSVVAVVEYRRHHPHRHRTA